MKTSIILIALKYSLVILDPKVRGKDGKHFKGKMVWVCGSGCLADRGGGDVRPCYILATRIAPLVAVLYNLLC